MLSERVTAQGAAVPASCLYSVCRAAILFVVFAFPNPAAANTCSGGSSKITNQTCDGILYVFACYGDKGQDGHGAQSLKKGESVTLDLAANSTYAAKCGAPPAETCDATWCADGKDHDY